MLGGTSAGACDGAVAVDCGPDGTATARGIGIAPPMAGASWGTPWAGGIATMAGGGWARRRR